MSIASHYSVTVSMADVQVNCIAWFHQSRPSKWEPAVPYIQGCLILVLFIFHWGGRSYIQASSSPDLLHCGTDSSKDAYLITTIWTSSSLGVIVIFPTYPINMQPLLIPCMPLQHPHLVTLYLEWYFGFVLSKQ